jgi:hypothetical protein
MDFSSSSDVFDAKGWKYLHRHSENRSNKKFWLLWLGKWILIAMKLLHFASILIAIWRGKIGTKTLSTERFDTPFCCWHFPSKFGSRSAYEAEAQTTAINRKTMKVHSIERLCHRVTVSRLFHLMLTQIRDYHENLASFGITQSRSSQWILDTLEAKTPIVIFGRTNFEPKSEEKKEKFCGCWHHLRVLRVAPNELENFSVNHVEIAVPSEGCSSISVIKIAIPLLESKLPTLPTTEQQKVPSKSWHHRCTRQKSELTSNDYRRMIKALIAGDFEWLGGAMM